LSGHRKLPARMTPAPREETYVFDDEEDEVDRDE
jgi:hypothetical protein